MGQKTRHLFFGLAVACLTLTGCISGSTPNASPSVSENLTPGPSPSPTPTTDEPTPPPATPSSPSGDPTYPVVLPEGGVSVPLPDGDYAGHLVYANFSIGQASVVISDNTTQLTMSGLCAHYTPSETLCLDGTVVWSGPLMDATAVVQDPNDAHSWASVTLSDSQATLTPPPANCAMPDGTIQTPTMDGEIHYYCT